MLFCRSKIWNIGCFWFILYVHSVIKSQMWLDMLLHAFNPALGKQRQENLCELQASQDYMRVNLKTNRKKQTSKPENHKCEDSRNTRTTTGEHVWCDDLRSTLIQTSMPEVQCQSQRKESSDMFWVCSTFAWKQPYVMLSDKIYKEYEPGRVVPGSAFSSQRYWTSLNLG